MIFEPCLSLLPHTERPSLGWRQQIEIKTERHVCEVVRCNGLELQVRKERSSQALMCTFSHKAFIFHRGNCLWHVCDGRSNGIQLFNYLRFKL